MLNVEQFREFIVVPTLHSIGLYSKAAEQLLIATALVETNLTFIKQLGSGPALGVYQIEPNTERDVWENFLNHRSQLGSKVAELKLGIDDELIGNLYYATAIARICYYRIPAPLPKENDISGMAHYWKNYYNTSLGAGTVLKFVERSKQIFEGNI